jgi:hypothetical protein
MATGSSRKRKAQVNHVLTAFTQGFARALDLGAVLHSRTGRFYRRDADTRALRSDWLKAVERSDEDLHDGQADHA